jgi:GNAT superfamily N-acetyltransferase
MFDTPPSTGYDYTHACPVVNPRIPGASWMKFSIREVDGNEATIGHILLSLDRILFPEDAFTRIDPKTGFWWIAFTETLTPFAYAGMKPAARTPNAGYLHRCGVLPDFRGAGLQRRLIQIRVRKAKQLGFESVVSDTNDLASANNLIRCGFRLHKPVWKWGTKTSLYWQKQLGGTSK